MLQAFGSSSMQALVIALQLMCVELTLLPEYHDGRLTLGGEPNFNLLAPLSAARTGVGDPAPCSPTTPPARPATP